MKQSFHRTRRRNGRVILVLNAANGRSAAANARARARSTTTSKNSMASLLRLGVDGGPSSTIHNVVRSDA
jgi:hypothetical protein